MSVNMDNLEFPFGGSGGALADFRTPETFTPGSWIITSATLTTRDALGQSHPLGELAGVPKTALLPGGPGEPMLDFTGGRCL